MSDEAEAPQLDEFDTILGFLESFRDLLRADLDDWKQGRTRSKLRQISQVRPFAEIIARLYASDAVEALRSVSSPSPSPGWIWTEALAATDRIIGRLEYRKQTVKDLRQAGPVLAANQLHPWVWNAAAGLWASGSHEPAVHVAALAVALRTQKKVAPIDSDGMDLYAAVFSTADPRQEAPRLRFPDIDKSKHRKLWLTAHKAAQHFAMGCAQIVGVQSHPFDSPTEHEALEQLAALSVLARWVDACRVVRAAPAPPHGG